MNNINSNNMFSTNENIIDSKRVYDMKCKNEVFTIEPFWFMKDSLPRYIDDTPVIINIELPKFEDLVVTYKDLK